MIMRSKKLIYIGLAIIVLLIILIAVYSFCNRQEEQGRLFQTYDEALNWGMSELGNKAIVLKDVKVVDTFNNTNLVFFALEDITKAYISKITSDESGYQCSRLTPTFSWTNEDKDANVAFDVPIIINDKEYYVLIGKVDKSSIAYSNEEELELGLNRIFIKITPEKENQVRFE